MFDGLDYLRISFFSPAFKNRKNLSPRYLLPNKITFINQLDYTIDSFCPQLIIVAVRALNVHSIKIIFSDSIMLLSISDSFSFLTLLK